MRTRAAAVAVAGVPCMSLTRKLQPMWWCFPPPTSNFDLVHGGSGHLLPERLPSLPFPTFPGPSAMDSPAVTQLFRQLFRQPHPACLARRTFASVTTAVHRHHHHHHHHHHHYRRRQLRALSSARGGRAARGSITTSEKERAWQQRSNVFPQEKSEELQRYPLVTANELRSYKERPRRVRMLMRDFIEGASSNHLRSLSRFLPRSPSLSLFLACQPSS